MTLPVLSLAVKPTHFFLAAPLLLLVLYWNIVAHDRRLSRSVEDVCQRTRPQGLEYRELASVIPELERARMNWKLKCRLMLPDLATAASLLLLLQSGQRWIPACTLAAVVLTIAYRLREGLRFGRELLQ
jgi:hypothetical protein